MFCRTEGSYVFYCLCSVELIVHMFLHIILHQYIVDNFCTCLLSSRNCFLAYFTHKFRSTIGKSKQIHPGDRVLVGLSGGTSSTALLHLIHEGLQENSHKKLRFNPAFLYIDGISLFYCFYTCMCTCNQKFC